MTLGGRLLTGMLMAGLLAPTAVAAKADRVESLEALAAEENGEALYHLGMMYLTGTSVARDQRRAVKHFEKAYELGDPLAAYKLGCFYDGQYRLFDIDLDLALAMKLKAAEAGYALAQQDVAGLYARKSDYGSALMWLKRAADQGTRSGLMAYSSVHNGAEGFVNDAVVTAGYFRVFLKLHGGSEQQRSWLRKFEANLSPEERKEARAIARGYKAQPTELTRKALSGLSAADQLIDKAG